MPRQTISNRAARLFTCLAILGIAGIAGNGEFTPSDHVSSGLELNDQASTAGVSFSPVASVDDGASGGSSTLPEPAGMPLFAAGLILILAGCVRHKNQADSTESKSSLH